MAQRQPHAISLVIDRSGSMQGRPLDEAKRCAKYVLGRLRPSDYVSPVQFDDRVRRLWPAVPLGDGASLKAAIAGITAGGNTNLHGGWAERGHVAEERRAKACAASSCCQTAKQTKESSKRTRSLRSVELGRAGRIHEHLRAGSQVQRGTDGDHGTGWGWELRTEPVQGPDDQGVAVLGGAAPQTPCPKGGRGLVLAQRSLKVLHTFAESRSRGRATCRLA